MSDIESTFTVVPAAPGFVLHYIMSEEPEIQKPGEVIIAWVVDHYIDQKNRIGAVVTNATPVTAAGITGESGQAYVIENPDGTVAFPENTVVESFEAALEHLAKYRKAE